MLCGLCYKDAGVTSCQCQVAQPHCSKKQFGLTFPPGQSSENNRNFRAEIDDKTQCEPVNYSYG